MNDKLIKRRRDLVPLWMKVFIWIFIFIGASSIITRLFSIFGIQLFFNSETEKTIYGMSTYENYSFIAILISTLIIFKGITAFGMWTEKSWAIKFGIIDGIAGIIICIIMMFIEPLVLKEEKYNINFRFEILLLIPYLIKCFKINQQWNYFTPQNVMYSAKSLNRKIIESTTNSDKNVENGIIKKETTNFTNENLESDEDYLRKYMPK